MKLKLGLKDKLVIEAIDMTMSAYGFFTRMLFVLFLALLFYGDKIIEFYSSLSTIQNIGMYGVIFTASFYYIVAVIRRYLRLVNKGENNITFFPYAFIIILLLLISLSSLILLSYYTDMIFEIENIFDYSFINIPNLLTVFHIFVINIFSLIAFSEAIRIINKIINNFKEIDKMEDKLTISIAIVALIISILGR